MGLIKKLITRLYDVRMSLSKGTGVGITILSNKDNIKPKESFYNLSATANDGELIDFARYSGKKVLLVNVASECGYTPQYKELEKLHQLYKSNLVVLGFPANDFGGQEPDSDKNIASFCERNFGITFQLFSKGIVTGKIKQPVYEWLANPSKNGWNSKEPTWNFCKYLVDEEGNLLQFFSSSVSPLSNNIVKAISA